MQHFWSLDDVHLKNAWLTIGSFDGVHRGHQEIIRKITAGAHASGDPAVVLTFYPHPAVILGRRDGPFYLTTPEEQADLMAKMGVDVTITHPFNREVANTSARDFMQQLSDHLGLRHLCVGYDFALGHGREGNVETLQKLGKEMGYQVHILEAVQEGGLVVSSSEIRTALLAGDIELANHLLGRPYQIRGRVVHGDGRGKTIGVPTANLNIWSERLLPKSGVYVCQAEVEGSVWGAVTNIGIRPTFEDQAPERHVEAHLLDFDRDLYGEEMKLSFLLRLRDEQRFPNVGALIAQIQEDIARGRSFLQQEK